MRVAREEIFGPVLCALPYEDDEHAVPLAYDSDYGLAGTVWTNDINRRRGLAERIHTGTIGINHSGHGRGLGPEGLAGNLEAKAITSAGR